MNYDLLQSYLNRDEISWRNLAAKTGIPHSTLKRAIEKKTLTVEQLETICKSYKWPIYEFLASYKNLIVSEPEAVYNTKQMAKIRLKIDKLRKSIDELENDLTAALDT